MQKFTLIWTLRKGIHGTPFEISKRNRKSPLEKKSSENVKKLLMGRRCVRPCACASAIGNPRLLSSRTISTERNSIIASVTRQPLVPTDFCYVIILLIIICIIRLHPTCVRFCFDANVSCPPPKLMLHAPLFYSLNHCVHDAHHEYSAQENRVRRLAREQWTKTWFKHMFDTTPNKMFAKFSFLAFGVMRFLNVHYWLWLFNNSVQCTIIVNSNRRATDASFPDRFYCTT